MDMMSKEDATNSTVTPQLPNVSGARRMFWRSASWSSSRTALQNPDVEDKDSGADPVGNNGHNRRYPAPLTPRSQQNCKARSCLPPLQPLSIARRSLEEWPKAGSDDLGEWPHPPTPSGNKTGERLKLDLSSIQKNPDSNGGLGKKERIAFFDKECSKVAEHVYLGGDAVARDREILKRNGITHVLNCVGFVCPEYFKGDFVYRTLWLQDSPSEDITSILYDVFDYFEDVREQGGRVFVHCCQGVSRSTSLVIAYLMWREGQTFDDAFQYVKAARGIADPNMGFACQLLQCQKRVHAFPLSPSSLLRIYRIAPHSPYDPLHLVPRMLNDPSPFALDSRGAFIVHIPTAIYVWVGKTCEPIMERDARGAVCQILRYEKAQGPVIMVKEGEEPSYFWDAFSSYLPLMDKSGDGAYAGDSVFKTYPGERKVDAYNIDFEIFQKAIKGGFVPPFSSSEDECETHLPARESCWSALRRKYAPVGGKEFPPAPKILLSRVYSDSVIILHASSPSSSSSSSSSSSLSSSSSSPPYLSPDSISSDSSICSKYMSESSLDSPSAARTLSNLSSLSLLSSGNSSQPTSNNPGFIDVNITSRRCSHLSFSPSKKSSPSLAERRGSLSKSLKLPAVTDQRRMTDTPPTSLASLEDDTDITKNSFSWCDSANVEMDLELVSNVKEGYGASIRGCKSSMSPSILTTSETFDKEPTFIDNYDESVRQHILGEDLGRPTKNGMDCCLPVCNQKKCLVHSWPSLERIADFGASNLDSKAVFLVIGTNSGLGREDNRILYVWVGRSFSCDRNTMQLHNNKEIADLEWIDWNQAACHILTQMGLPGDIPVKVIKEGLEPADFLALLN